MYGEHTDPAIIQRLQNAFDNERLEQAEIGLLKKNKTQIWLLANIAPIKDDKSRVVLYLCQFKDITALKQPLDDENNKGNTHTHLLITFPSLVLGLSRILQIARIAKSRQQFNQIETKDLHSTKVTGASSNLNQVCGLWSCPNVLKIIRMHPFCICY
jgi:hypothetical protein